MTFSDLNFIFRLLPIFLLIYYIVPASFRKWVLLLGSLGFYYLNEPRLILVLAVMTCVNWIFAQVIHKTQNNLALGTVVILNVATLCFFKFAKIGFGLSVIIPLGLSYYIFKMISYQVDLYKGKIQSVSFINMANYFVMFPQIIAGPIAREGYVEENIFWQKSDAKILNQIEEGLKFFVIGLFMKLIIADHLAVLWSDLKVIGYESISTPLAWLGAYAYSLNLYFDFWGYSLMAAGIGVMLGFPFIRNFNQPYFSASISEFYRRWHSTLGEWFKDYVYFPLGGSRKGQIHTVINLIVVWLLTGIWHGYTLNFLIWGMSICCIIIFEKLFLSRFPKLFAVIGRINVLVIIPITWVVFAIHSVGNLRLYLLRMFPVIDISVAVNKNDVFYYLKDYWLFLMLGIVFSIPVFTSLFKKYKDNVITVLVIFAMFWISIFSLSNSAGNPFMYLRF